MVAQVDETKEGGSTIEFNEDIQIVARLLFPAHEGAEDAERAHSVTLPDLRQMFPENGDISLHSVIIVRPCGWFAHTLTLLQTGTSESNFTTNLGGRKRGERDTPC